MTIQPSLVIWTVICFTAMYFILKYLLFNPLLKVMDEREKKIGDARRVKEEAAEQAEEQRRFFAEQREQKAREDRAEAEKLKEKLRMEGREKLEEARKDQYTTVEEYRRKTDAEYESDMVKIKTFTEDAADSFLSRLLKN